jgi:hypothetical protein
MKRVMPGLLPVPSPDDVRDGTQSPYTRFTRKTIRRTKITTTKTPTITLSFIREFLISVK